MNRNTTIVTLLLPLCFGFARQPEQSAQAAVKALGGPQAVKRLDDFSAKGQVIFYMYGREMAGDLSILKKGDKERNKYELQYGSSPYVVIYVFNGTTAFVDRMGTVSDLPALDYLSDNDHSFQLLIQPNVEYSTGKATEIDGESVTGLIVRHHKKATVFYLSNKDRLIKEMVFSDLYYGDNDTRETLEKRIRYADYKTVDGVQFPHKWTFFKKGKKEKVYLLTEVTFSPQIDSQLFERPEQELDLRYGEERMHD